MALELKWVQKDWGYGWNGASSSSKWHVALLDTNRSYRVRRPQDDAAEVETLCGNGLTFGYSHGWTEKDTMNGLHISEICTSCQKALKPWADFCFANAKPKWEMMIDG